MASRRDQLHSYQFATQRMISAFVMRETDPAQSPLRRGVGAVFGGVMVSVLLAAGFGIAGLITKVGGDRWRSSGSVIIEKETGATFVYLDDTLHPTLNYTSAVLIAGRTTRPFRVAAKALRAAPRGVTLGVPGLPDSLPGRDRLVGLPWTVCATPGVDSTGRPVSTVTLVAARAPSAGRSLAEEAMLVEDPTADATFLVWHGRRHLMREAGDTVPALFGEVDPAPVATSWLNTLPVAADIAPITVADAGEPSTAVAGRNVGDVLTTETGSGPQHYLVLDDGRMSLTPLQLAMLRAKNPVEPVRAEVSAVNALPTSGRAPPGTGDLAPPAAAPDLVQIAGTDQVCAVTTDAGSPPTVVTQAVVDGLGAAVPTGSVSAAGGALADRVLVPPGSVAVVRAMGAPSAAGGPYYVVTDLGVKHAVASDDVLGVLGYPVATAVGVPAELLGRIPNGPTLDPAQAVQPAGAAAGDPAAGDGSG